VNNVIQRHWTTRTMVQDVLNTSVQVYFNLRVMLEVIPASASATAVGERDAVLARIRRRLSLAFRVILLAARTDVEGAHVHEEVAAALGRLRAERPGGVGPLLSDEEAAVLGEHRRVYVVLGWVLRDLVGLVDHGHVHAMRLGDLAAAIGKLRTLGNDIPMYVRVQLPFAAVALVACVVHLTLAQVVYVSASFIGAGFATPNMSAKAFSGIFAVVVIPSVFLSILKLQALLSNPFGKFAAATNFPVEALENELEHMLDEIECSLGEKAVKSVGCLGRAAAGAAAAHKKGGGATR
jgi:hypothetical protein